MRAYSQPLDQLRLGAYRRTRWDAVADLLDDGYVQRLPPEAKAWMSRYMREHYGANATALRSGLHADRLRPEHIARLPRRMRIWWGRQREMWPVMAVCAAAKRLGLQAKDLDSTLRRSVYAEQNAATRDVYSLRRVVYLEELGGRDK